MRCLGGQPALQHAQIEARCSVSEKLLGSARVCDDSVRVCVRVCVLVKSWLPQQDQLVVCMHSCKKSCFRRQKVGKTTHHGQREKEVELAG